MKKTTRAHALPFKQTREHHNAEAAEDYTELIDELIIKHGQARTCAIAEELGVSHVTALRTLKRLKRDGYVDTSPHRPVLLTAKGKRTAQLARERHLILVDFFVRVGVPRAIAQVDVEGAEHHISRTTLAAVKKFLKKCDPQDH